MKHLLLAAAFLLPLAASAQQTANEMTSAAPTRRDGESQEQHGQRLLAEMLKALGGDAWLNKKTEYLEGQSAPFFQGQPSGGVQRFVEWKQFSPTQPQLARVEYVSYRGIIEPGTVRQVAHLWLLDQGYEFTFKGRTPLPEKQVKEYLLVRRYSLEEIMRVWVKQPGVIILFEGIGTRDRRPIDKISILATNNETVTLELEQDSHFPLQRGFEVRNDQFKDHDLDEEVYGDWRLIDGVGTPMNVTRYKNGDIVDQTFYKKIRFNQPQDASLFDKDKPLKK